MKKLLKLSLVGLLGFAAVSASASSSERSFG